MASKYGDKHCKEPIPYLGPANGQVRQIARENGISLNFD